MSAPIVFDRNIYAMRRLKAARVGGASFLLRQAADNLAERLSAANGRFPRALDLGSRAESFAILSPFADRWVRTSMAPDVGGASIVIDEEALPFAMGSFDLVTSVLILHGVNDLPGVLIQLRRALAPGGFFLAALFGGATLGELRRAFAAGEAETAGGASPRVAPFADVRDLGGLLQRAGFADPVADVESTGVRYRSFATLADDLRTLGETNALAQRQRRFLTRGVLAAALRHYAAADSDSEGRLCATFDVIYLTGRAARANR
ncbi:MAG TPA: methyltransferase domain-containing protein [Rhizomicrobium sp.]